MSGAAGPEPQAATSAPAVEDAAGARLVAKRFIDRCRRHQRECYNAVLDPRPHRTAVAYLRVEGKRESLILRPGPDEPEVVIARETYVLSPLFVDGFLLWVERVGRAWKILAVRLDGLGSEKPFEPFVRPGRPLSLSCCSHAGRSWLTWEERTGRQTRIVLAAVEGDRFGEPVEVTDGAFNAYDPVACVDSRGTLWLAWCAFAGNYRIHLQPFTAEGRPAGEPRCISDEGEPCVYPSLCPRQDGGLWFSYTHLDAPDGEQPFLTDPRHLAQHHVVMSDGRIVAGVFDKGELWAPFAPGGPGAVQAFQAAGYVLPSRHAGHSRIFEAPSGQAWILFRQHGPLKPARFQQQDEPLSRSHVAGTTSPSTNHPDICLTALQAPPFGWSSPIRLICRAHVEAPISHSVDGSRVRFAFTEDARHTGWSVAGELFDGTGEVGVGIAEVQLPSTAGPRCDLRPLVLRPAPGPSIAEPQLPRAPGEKYVCALGQTHAHTSLSVCRRETDREPHLAYRFMQDVMGNDFGGITDHCYNMWHTEVLIMHKLAEYYYFPGEFVAVPAYEWTGSHPECKHDGGPFGHMNPMLLEEEGDLDVYTPCDPASPGCSPAKLWSTYQGRKIITPPHHPVDNVHAWNWRDFDPTFVSVVEIFQSIRGSAEHPRAPGVANWLHRPGWPWVVDALKQGKRFGFIASADHGGIARACVLVKELTREGLHEGFTARRCLASTAISCRAELTCNGRMMGEEVPATTGEFRLLAQATGPLREIQIVRNGEDFARHPVGEPQVDHRWQANRQAPGEFWYCRLIFEDGNVVWTSPIWLV